jgi:hypothetical protein
MPDCARSGPLETPLIAAFSRFQIKVSGGESLKEQRKMHILQRVQNCFLLIAAVAQLYPAPVVAQANSAAALDAAQSEAQEAALERNGEHDFDFEIGTWKTKIRRLQHPLTGSTAWTEYDGITVVRKVWQGRANLAELEADGPAGHLEVLSLRLYDPQAHQWSLNTANSKVGTISVPTIGEFKNARGEFYDTELLNGRSILVRNVWSDINPDSCRFEQSFSTDGGKTWQVNWIANDKRVKDEPADNISRQQ